MRRASAASIWTEAEHSAHCCRSASVACCSRDRRSCHSFFIAQHFIVLIGSQRTKQSWYCGIVQSTRCAAPAPRRKRNLLLNAVSPSKCQRLAFNIAQFSPFTEAAHDTRGIEPEVDLSGTGEACLERLYRNSDENFVIAVAQGEIPSPD